MAKGTVYSKVKENHYMAVVKTLLGEMIHQPIYLFIVLVRQFGGLSLLWNVASGSVWNASLAKDRLHYRELEYFDMLTPLPAGRRDATCKSRRPSIPPRGKKRWIGFSVLCKIQAPVSTALAYNYNAA